MAIAISTLLPTAGIPILCAPRAADPPARTLVERPRAEAEPNRFDDYCAFLAHEHRAALEERARLQGLDPADAPMLWLPDNERVAAAVASASPSSRAWLLDWILPGRPAPQSAPGEPRVRFEQGRILADSRDVAAAFGKLHKNVLRNIRDLIAKEPMLEGLNFELFTIQDVTDPNRGKLSHYEMDRDGFALLAMGFTGEKALRWKLKWIAAFNRMEAELRRPPADPLAALADPAKLRELLLRYAEAALSPRVASEAPPDFIVADGSLCLTDAAKTLGWPPKKFIAWLSACAWIYRRTGDGPWIGSTARLQSGELVHKIAKIVRSDGTTELKPQVRVSACGLSKLAELLKTAPR